MTENDFNFSEALAEVQEINDWFKESTVDLDKGLKKFRRGMSLINKCQKRLEEAENEFEDIKEEFEQLEKETDQSFD